MARKLFKKTEVISFWCLYSLPQRLCLCLCLSLMHALSQSLSLPLSLAAFTYLSLYLSGYLICSTSHQFPSISISALSRFKSPILPITMKWSIESTIDCISALLCHNLSCFDITWKSRHLCWGGERVADWKWNCTWSSRRDFRIAVRPLLTLICLKIWLRIPILYVLLHLFLHTHLKRHPALCLQDRKSVVWERV